MAFTTVQGTVTRTFFNGKGAEVTEQFKKRDGSEGKTRWTAWFEAEHGLSDGDAVEVSGMHSDQIDEWTDNEGGQRQTVKRSLNKAKIRTGQGQRAAVSAPADEPWASTPTESRTAQTGAGDTWNNPAAYDGTPF